VVVVLLLVAVVGAFYYTSPSNKVDITLFNVYAPDNVCGLNSYPIAYYGFNDTTGASDSLGFPVPNSNTTSCEIKVVTTNSSGFSLSDINTPLTIPFNGTGNLTLTLTLPSSPYTGVVNLVFM
jgi:hypothetical protein